jgi:hypothetical protein
MSGKARRFAPPKRLESFVRDWEWTWSRAGVFGLAFFFYILFTQAVIPSFLTYYFNAYGCPGLIHAIPGACKALFWDTHSMNQNMAQAIIMGWITVTFGGTLVVAVVLQNWRRRLRGPDHIRAGYRSAA